MKYSICISLVRRVVGVIFHSNILNQLDLVCFICCEEWLSGSHLSCPISSFHPLTAPPNQPLKEWMNKSSNIPLYQSPSIKNSLALLKGRKTREVNRKEILIPLDMEAVLKGRVLMDKKKIEGQLKEIRERNSLIFFKKILIIIWCFYQVIKKIYIFIFERLVVMFVNHIWWKKWTFFQESVFSTIIVDLAIFTNSLS